MNTSLTIPYERKRERERERERERQSVGDYKCCLKMWQIPNFHLQPFSRKITM
ncbi:MAG: hypothetical protein KTM48_03540 [Wolbachia endosymbiont of Pissodes strobi]|nr:hypothetical protein [Wolbachia endosymbiont of Pissodes strobi]